MNGLILQGGGARGAYQAGYLLGISEMLEQKSCPFTHISGISVGAINAALIASDPDNFRKSTLRLKNYWLNMTSEHVFKTRGFTLLDSVLKRNSEQANSLLDNSPLLDFLEKRIDFTAINAGSTARKVHLHIHAFSHSTQRNAVLSNTSESLIGADTILASTSIPMLFPRVTIDNVEYSDGGVMLKKPSNHLIKFGCRNILGISLNDASTQNRNYLLESIFPNALEEDYEKCIKINKELRNIGKLRRYFNNLKTINFHLARPSSTDFTRSGESLSQLPYALRTAIKLTSTNGKSPLEDYLIFEKEYAEHLIIMGRADALVDEKKLTAFLKPEDKKKKTRN